MVFFLLAFVIVLIGLLFVIAHSKFSFYKKVILSIITIVVVMFVIFPLTVFLIFHFAFPPLENQTETISIPKFEAIILERIYDKSNTF